MEREIIHKFSESESDTINLALSFSKNLRPGDIVILNGDLGAGKTTFVKGLAKGLGVDSHIKSPTFVIIKEYKGYINLIHIDTYRIDGNDIDKIGLEEYMDGKNLIIIEWNKFDLFSEKANYKIDMKYISQNQREIVISRLR
ncbi:MAG: tRNA (adenosine(37)-N6)-threonylcarbamoyltransferase complex ATPase subunit type 1 TsaE [Christensenellales bacterium]|jgi:tRNA threonylcarbamoyladenosine biosynthesis protein TsaE|nr:tRNA (adenosine(37)-N6)-threonylcarbamoyltransferase complex ATPase subunit type 1 TsaE [Clostridiales bacterium]